MRFSDWSSDLCTSDLHAVHLSRFRRISRPADRPRQQKYSRLVRADEEPPQHRRKLRRRMMAAENSEFEFCGVNHLALVCKDMARTVEFYRDKLGMPLTKTIDLPGGRGQHFFRSEDRRVGKEGVSTCRSRWSSLP